MLKSSATLAIIAALAAPLPAQATTTQPALAAPAASAEAPVLVKNDKGHKKPKKAKHKAKKAKSHDKAAKKAAKQAEKAAKKAAGKSAKKSKRDDDRVKVKREVKIDRRKGKYEHKIERKGNDRKYREHVRIEGNRAASAALLGAGVATLPFIWDERRYDALIDCPPGLAKKAVPCVPPGQAKKGVTPREWLASKPEWRDRDREDYDEWLHERRDVFDGVPEVERDWFLEQEYIMRTFDLDPPPEGHYYAVIDGNAVLLDEENYGMLRRVPRLSEVQVPVPDSPIPLDVLMSQDELIDTYNLPPAPEGSYYSVIDGHIVRLPSEEYEMLQMIRFLSLVA